MVHHGLKRLFLTVLTLSLLISICPAWGAAENSHDAVILFTHDTHDHFYPAPSEDGGEYGGYTRLATLLKLERVKYPDAITVDGGDFSMGTLFQTVYGTQAPELKALGAMGYDVTTLGNHEFDYRASGLAQMLETAAASGSQVPAIVQSNGTVLDGEGSQELIQAKQLILSEKEDALEKLKKQRGSLYDLLEQGIYTSEVFLTRQKDLSEREKTLMEELSRLQDEIEYERKIESERMNFIPKCKKLIDNYEFLSVQEKNRFLKELIDRIVYTKTERNQRGRGSTANFTLEIYPRVPRS